jgi:hypothetical protein
MGMGCEKTVVMVLLLHGLRVFSCRMGELCPVEGMKIDSKRSLLLASWE